MSETLRDFAEDLLIPCHKNPRAGCLVAYAHGTLYGGTPYGLIQCLAVPGYWDCDGDIIHYGGDSRGSYVVSDLLPIVVDLDDSFDYLIRCNIEDGWGNRVWKEYAVSWHFQIRGMVRPRLSPDSMQVQELLDRKLLIPCITTLPGELWGGYRGEEWIASNLHDYTSPQEQFGFIPGQLILNPGHAPAGTRLLVWNTSAGIDRDKLTDEEENMIHPDIEGGVQYNLDACNGNHYRLSK